VLFLTKIIVLTIINKNIGSIYYRDANSHIHGLLGSCQMLGKTRLLLVFLLLVYLVTAMAPAQK
jgi:hypothetical protein